jgi:4-hydroxybutyryl-CoA dehydratase/vinylacetyl-CoA-Delta-isomerase
MMVGEEYQASLFDGRATYFEGERVEDLRCHPLLGDAVGHASAGLGNGAEH